MRFIRLLPLLIFFAIAQITIAAHASDGDLHSENDSQRFCAACNAYGALDSAPSIITAIAKHSKEFGAPIFALVAAPSLNTSYAPFLARDPPSHI